MKKNIILPIISIIVVIVFLFKEDVSGLSLPIKTSCLKKVCENQVCGATTGKSFLKKGGEVVTDDNIANLKDYNLYKTYYPTSEILFDVYKNRTNVTLVDVLGSFKSNPRKLCFTMDQIVNILEKRKDVVYSQECKPIFFTTDQKGNIYGIKVLYGVIHGESHLYMIPIPVEATAFWGPDGPTFFVIPQQMTLEV